MGMAVILVNGPFCNLLYPPLPLPQEAPYEILAKLAQQLQRRSHLKIFEITNAPGSKLDLAIKRSNVNVRSLL